MNRISIQTYFKTNCDLWVTFTENDKMYGKGIFGPVLDKCFFWEQGEMKNCLTYWEADLVAKVKKKKKKTVMAGMNSKNG